MVAGAHTEIDALLSAWRRQRLGGAISVALVVILAGGSATALALATLKVPEPAIWAALAGLAVAGIAAGWWMASRPPQTDPVLRAVVDSPGRVFVRELVYVNKRYRKVPRIELATTDGQVLIISVRLGTEKGIVAAIVARAGRS